jgi:23S rRNA (cytosine1962-C5)-methyltransferase
MSEPRPISLRVSAEAERRIRQGHPWLYSQAILRQSRSGTAGDLAVIYDGRNRFLAIGLYDPASPLRVRILQRHRQAEIDRAWLLGRLGSAIDAREPLSEAGMTGYRMVHGESDGLPGLVLDRYGETLVLKLYTPAWIPRVPDVISALSEAWPSGRLILRLSRAVQGAGTILGRYEDGMLLSGRPLKGPVLFKEHGLTFEADPVYGQKTGFFLDQRDNRAYVETLTRGASVLDGFAYTGGFSVYAARGGAREVLSIDVSQPALEAARRNMAHNRADPAVRAARHDVLVSDAFDALEGLRRAKRSFDVVILDPPAFANRQAEVPAALRAYARLTRMGLGVLKAEGTLVISSCSGQVSEEAFAKAVYHAASQVKRPLRERSRTGHPLDHPVRFPEGAYLKCLAVQAGPASGPVERKSHAAVSRRRGG